jgi:glycosyltransferase involved in cell wall biosynthesis
VLGHAKFGDQARPILISTAMVNAFCFYYGDDSWARHARQFFRSLQKREEVNIISWDGPENASNAQPRRDKSSANTSVPGIGLGPIERMSEVVGSRRIAFVVWETTIIPPDKVRILQTMDAIWTPSTWGRQLLISNGFDESKVHVVPEGVDVEEFRPLTEQPRNHAFRFLFVGKWETRKGIAELIDVFCEEFRPDEPVELIVHGSNRYLPGFDLDAKVRSLVRGRTPSVIASHPCTEDELVRLYNRSDALVLPTRAEGWGLPVMEAMACALPVIVTDYSAPVDYLDQAYAYLIPVERLVPVQDPSFFRAGSALGQWAQPDFQQLRRLMRHVFENPAEAREKGRLARLEVANRWTWEHAAAEALQLLSQMA